MKWIIDTDPGIDDAAAIVAAIRSGAMDVIGLTTVSGNTPLHHTTRNALRLLDLMECDLPVYAGASQPLLQPAHYADYVHGADGFGDIDLPEPRRQPEPIGAVEFIIQSAHRYPGELSILALGPLTNLALAIAQDRSLVQKIPRIVLMGGTSDARGNTGIVTEFNIQADPEAAAMVFASGIPITMVPWETTLKAGIKAPDLDRLGACGKPLAKAFLAMAGPMIKLVEERWAERGLVVCDLLATAVIVDPACITEQVEAYVAVETAGSIGRGLTAVDYARLSGKPANTTVVLTVDVRRVADLFVRTFTA